MQVSLVDDKSAWNGYAEGFGAHPLQLWQWGELKGQTGPWTPYRLAVRDDDGSAVGGAQVLVRAMPFPFGAIAYAPRGPFAKEGRLAEVADAAADWCRDNTKSQSLKIDPAAGELAWPDGWEQSENILINKTAALSLEPDEDEIMKAIPNRKCRQYIRKGERDGVVVRPAEERDLDAVLALYHQTADADGFALHADEFYRTAFTALEGIQQFFVAEKDGEIQAFLWNVTSKGGMTFELWGAVNDAGKRDRANYYMKWVAIKEAKKAGAALYDLNGLLNDGISDFKLLFVPEPTYWVETHDKPLRSLYHAMNKALVYNRKRNERNNAQKDTARD